MAKKTKEFQDEQSESGVDNDTLVTNPVAGGAPAGDVPDFQDDQSESGMDDKATGRPSSNTDTRSADGGFQDEQGGANTYAKGGDKVPVPDGQKLYRILTQNAIIGGVKYDVGDKVAIDPDSAAGYQRGGIGLEEV